MSINDIERNIVVTRFAHHKSAVKSLDFLPSFSLMMSCAFDLEPKLWMATTRAGDGFTLRDTETPHIHHVVDVCHILDSPIVSTLDITGMLKIWDVRMFKCHQTIRLPDQMDGIFDPASLKWNSLVYDEKNLELVACAHRRIQKVKKKSRKWR